MLREKTFSANPQIITAQNLLCSIGVPASEPNNMYLLHIYHTAAHRPLSPFSQFVV